jgi:16S rRNA (uracil1498-N3)-methyltransferase
VNLILFESSEIDPPVLPIQDPRAQHVLNVLRRSKGDSFDVGLVDGPRGKATLLTINAEALTLGFTWGTEPPALDPIALIIGLPRPQTARKILQEATALGVRAVHFFRSEKGESSYGQSTLWSSGEWRRHVITGAEQAFDTRLPQVTHGLTLEEVVARISNGATAPTWIALDNYESPGALSSGDVRGEVVLALGPERGWSAGERDLLRSKGFRFAHLGPRVLRTETAVVAAVAIIKARLGKF